MTSIRNKNTKFDLCPSKHGRHYNTYGIPGKISFKILKFI